MKNLTSAQWIALELMANGYEASNGGPMGEGPWLQKGGIGKGGETAKITVGTLTNLLERGYIQVSGKTGFSTRTFVITEAGRSALLSP